LIFETIVDFEYEFPPKRIRRHPPIFFEFFHLILNAFFPMYPTLFFGIFFGGFSVPLIFYRIFDFVLDLADRKYRLWNPRRLVY